MKNKLDVLEIKYEPEDDVLNVFFSKKPVDDSYDVKDLDYLAVMHVDASQEPVYLEVFDASKHLNSDLKSLPNKIKQEFFAPV